MWYLLLYIIAVIVNYYSVRALDKYIETKIKKRNWIWKWDHIILIAVLSLCPILTFIVILIGESPNFIKLPKDPPSWL